jgi:uncharacterized membrane-anchored protein
MKDKIREELMKENLALREVLDELIDMNIANRGGTRLFNGPAEFISCYTCRSSGSMTAKERKNDKNWALWDKARRLLGEDMDTIIKQETKKEK